MTQPATSANRRLSVITVDQAIAGASNVLAAVLAARLLGVDSFARFEIVFLVYVLVGGIGRALCCEPLLVHPDEVDERPGDSIGTTFVVASVMSGLVLVGAAFTLLWDRPTAIGLTVLAVALPLMFIQDLGRYLGFATQRPSLALILDTVWLVGMIVFAVLLAQVGANTLTWVLVVWAGTGALAGCYVLWRFRRHTPRPNLSWLRETWGFSWRYLLSFSAGQGTSLGASLALGAIVDARALGAARGASLLVRPSLTVQAAGAAASTADISRNRASGRAVRSAVLKVTVLTTAAGLLNTGVLLLLPDKVGVQLLGATWESARPLFLPAGLHIIMAGLVTCMRSGMLGIRAVRTVVLLDLWANPILFVIVVAGTYMGGLRGFYWACVVAVAVTALIWLVTFLSTTRKLDGGPDGGSGRAIMVAA